MPTNLTEVSSFDANVQVPVGTDAFSLAGLVAAFQNLANRSRYFKDNALIHNGTVAGAKNVDVGANALTLTGAAGATTISRTGAGTITIDGAGGATVTSSTAATLVATGAGNASVSAAGGNATVTAGGAGAARVTSSGSGVVELKATGTGALNVSTADGDVAISCGGANDMTISSGQDIILSPTGVCTVTASKMVFSGTGWPVLGSRTISNHVPPYGMIVESDSGVPAFAMSTSGRSLVQQMVTGGSIVFHLWFPPGTVVNSVSANIQSIGQPAAGLPGTMPVVTLSVLDDVTGVGTQLATGSDPSGTAGAFAAHHAVTRTPGTPHTVAAGTHLALIVDGSFDADPNRWVRMSAPTANVTMTALRLA